MLKHVYIKTHTESNVQFELEIRTSVEQVLYVSHRKQSHASSARESPSPEPLPEGDPNPKTKALQNRFRV